LSAISDKSHTTASSSASLPDVCTHDIRESDLLPRIIDVKEFIRRKPRTLEEVRDYFEFSQELTFKTLMEQKLAGKIWYELLTKRWNYGIDKNPIPVQAEKELEIGV